MFSFSSTVVATLVDALARTVFMLVVSVVAIRRIHVSSDVDAFFDKILRRRRQE